MKIKLTISERVYAISIINQFKGTLETMVDLIEDTKNIRITDKEWEKANKKVTTSMDEEGKPVTTMTWEDGKVGEVEMDISKGTKEYLESKIKEANDKGLFTFQDRAAITLSEKLFKKLDTEKEK